MEGKTKNLPKTQQIYQSVSYTEQTKGSIIMCMAKKSVSSKSLQAFLAREKKVSPRALREWSLACNTNAERGDVYGHEYFKAEFPRSDWRAPEGATKITHICDTDGTDFEYIVVKRFSKYGWDAKGNQCTMEIDCWQKFASTSDADYLCPILKFFKSKSDKVSDNSRKMQDNVVIISQKAVKVGNLHRMCIKAEEMNIRDGLIGTPASTRERRIGNFADSQGWWDVRNNGGNCGVVFDYAQNCWKAVIIDYAL